MTFSVNFEKYFSSKSQYFVQEVDFKKAFRVTAEEIAKYCQGYSAALKVPKRGTKIKEDTKEGKLPSEERAKAGCVKEVVNWLFDNSEDMGLYYFLLHDEYPPKDKREVAKFDYHDDACCWVLNLSFQEYQDLVHAWLANDLPEDLFLDEDEHYHLYCKACDYK